METDLAKPNPLDNPVVWFRSLSGASPEPKLFKAGEATSSTDSPGVSSKWAAVKPWHYHGPQPPQASEVDHDKGDWVAQAYAEGDLVRHGPGIWWQALKAAKTTDVPGSPSDSAAPVWQEREHDTSTPWSDSSTASTETPGSFRKGYVATTSTSDGVTVYWQASGDTSKTDVPGAAGQSNLWIKVGAQVYAGPQPTDGDHAKGEWKRATEYKPGDLVQYLDGNWYKATREVHAGSSEVPGPLSDTWRLQTESTATRWDSEARDADKSNPGSYSTGWVIERPISESSLCSGPAADGSVRPLSRMADDLRRADAQDSENTDPTIPSSYPKITLIIPSRCRVDSALKCADGTSGGPTSLRKFLDEQLLGSDDAVGIAKSEIFKKDGFVVTAWDRPASGSAAAGGALVLSPFTRAGKSNSRSYDTFSLTRTIQDRFALAGGAGMPAYLGISDKSAPLGRDVFPAR
jgi:hypothetical protein